MRLLLDTHILLWSILASPSMPRRGEALVRDPGNELFCSAAAIWEVAIKFAKARGRPDDMPMSAVELLGELEPLAIEMLAINEKHAAAVDALPPLHKDPFDRLLLAQARHEHLLLLTHDEALAAYGEGVLKV